MSSPTTATLLLTLLLTLAVPLAMYLSYKPLMRPATDAFATRREERKDRALQVGSSAVIAAMALLPLGVWWWSAGAGA